MSDWTLRLGCTFFAGAAFFCAAFFLAAIASILPDRSSRSRVA